MFNSEELELLSYARELDKEYYTLLTSPNTKIKNKHYKLLKKYDLDIASVQGWRSTHEDSHIHEINGNNILLAVFDGHGGDWVANYCASHYSNILFNTDEYKNEDYEKAFIIANRIMDEKIYDENREKMYNYCKNDISKKLFRHYHRSAQMYRTKFHHSDECGCTCCAVLITPDKIITSNIGDSKAILIRGRHVYSLSEEHKVTLSYEEARILNTVYTIKDDRINGVLNLSRGFGDFNYKDMENYDEKLMGIISTPEIKVVGRLPGYDRIVIGCDGLWDCYGELDVRNYFEVSKEYIDSNSYELNCIVSMFNNKWLKNIKIKLKDESEIVKKLVESCIAGEEDLIDEYNYNGFDNITVMVIKV